MCRKYVHYLHDALPRVLMAECAENPRYKVRIIRTSVRLPAFKIIEMVSVHQSPSC